MITNHFESLVGGSMLFYEPELEQEETGRVRELYQLNAVLAFIQHTVAHRDYSIVLPEHLEFPVTPQGSLPCAFAAE